MELQLQLMILTKLNGNFFIIFYYFILLNNYKNKYHRIYFYILVTIIIIKWNLLTKNQLNKFLLKI